MNFIRYGMRILVAEAWLQEIPETAWEYVFLKFWRTPQADLIMPGPLLVREVPWEQWEKEQGLANPHYRRLEIRHWGVQNVASK